MLRFLYQQNYTEEQILKTAEYVCKRFADQDSFVCRGITSQFKDEFLYVLGKLVFRPRQLCGLILTGCGTPIDPFDTSWNVSLPPRRSLKIRHSSLHSLHSSERRPFRILQLSDLHFDPDYIPGSEADCEQPVCCNRRPPNGDAPKKRAGFWGTAAKCDIPLRTIENMLQHINRTHKIDLVLLTGDYIHHRDWEYTRAGHLSAIGILSELLQKNLHGTPIFWTLGNHEAVPTNAFGPHFVPERYRPDWMYKAILDAANKTSGGKIPASAVESALYRGSFALDYGNNLRLISLNNGYCDNTNMFIYINQTDPDGSLSWLVNELWQAEKTEKFVYIMAHIPPGDTECLESWSRNYYRIVVRFADSIRAQFFGHTHFDSFSLFFSDMNDARSAPVSVLFTAPSVTTFEGLNPAYRIYDVHPQTWEVLDFETHFLNLSAQKDDQPPHWDFLYSAKSEYGLRNLGAAEWNELTERIERDPEIARKFNRNYLRRSDVPVCEKKSCLAARICSIRAAHHNKKALCRTLGEDIYEQRGEETTLKSSKECGVKGK